MLCLALAPGILSPTLSSHVGNISYVSVLLSLIWIDNALVQHHLFHVNRQLLPSTVKLMPRGFQSSPLFFFSLLSDPDSSIVLSFFVLFHFVLTFVLLLDT